MVIANLIGGLGNQMFQYAAGRSLASRCGAELKLDISGFEVYQKNEQLDYRQYMLGNFCISERFVSDGDKQLFNFNKPCKNKFQLYLKKVFLSARTATYFKERQFHYDEAFELLDGNVYLEGHWNSEKYFKSVADQVRHDFKLKHPPSSPNAALLEKIRQCHSVAVHVRRGDYVTNVKASQVHGVCDLVYYRKCVDYLTAKIDRPHFFVFSDDHEWVRENFKIDSPLTIVDHNGPMESHEDLRLMSHCEHQIIANSTLSWWGAWLNDQHHKMVLAPRRWFSSNKYNTKDLIPADWVTL